ncbi:MAG: hypothetical protein CUN57_02245, partial [Phototrophicales bacterium]
MYGRPRDGKSKYIKDKFEACSQKSTVTVGYNFSATKFVSAISPALKALTKNQSFGVHFDILPWRDANDEFLPSMFRILFRILYQFLTTGLIVDHQNGKTTLLTAPHVKWHLYFEIPTFNESFNVLD